MDLRYQSSVMCIIMGGRHTPVVCNESREPHVSHYPRPATKKTTNKLLIASTIPVDR